MKKFIIKITVLTTIVYGIIMGTNYIADPANLFGNELVEDAVNKLSAGKIIESQGDFDEGIFQADMINKMEKVPETVIIGSSQIMYADWKFKDYYVAGLTSAHLGDYYSIIGVLESAGKLPKNIVIGVDPYAFMFDHTGYGHKSLQVYAEKAWASVSGENSRSIKNNNFDKICELFSFSYFQNSLMAFRSRGILPYFNGKNKSVEVSDTDDMGQFAKILPNGKRIMSLSALHSVKENDNNVIRDIKANAVYQYGGQLKYLDKRNFEDFEKLIKYLQNKGIIIDIYMSAKYPDLYTYLNSDADYKAVMEVEKEIRKKIGGGYGIAIHGSYNPFITNIHKEDFADYLHLLPEAAIRNYETIVNAGKHK